MARGRAGGGEAAPQGGGEGLPEDLRLFTPFPFGGMDAKGSVVAIPDDRFVWLENVVLIGDGQLALMADNNPTPIYTAPGALTITSYFFYEFTTPGTVPVITYYVAVFLSDGSAYQVKLSDLTQKLIGAAGTFSTGSTAAMALWASTYLLIGTINAYFAWDGNALFGPGGLSPQVTITSGGIGYTSAPTVAIAGGAGTPPLATATVDNGEVTAVTLSGAGTGYLTTDGPLLNVIFTGGGITNRIAQGTATIGGGGVTSVQITDGGTGYTNEPTVTFSGGGASTQATAVAAGQANSITTVLIVTPGVGYTSAPTVTFSAPSGGGDTATGVASIGLNGITAITVTDGGSGYTNTPTVVITDPFGSGTGATAIAQLNAGVVASVRVVNPGENYTSAVVRFVGGNPAVAAATVELMPFGGLNPISAIAIEVFKNRVWAVNNNFRYTSATGSIANFAAADGGVIAQNTDSFLTIALYGLKQSSNFLYEFGDSSINAISNPITTLNSSLGTASTSYTVTNIDPQIGTIWGLTIQPFGSTIVFACPLGIFALYGSSLKKISTELDDLLVNLQTTVQDQPPSAAIVTLFGIKFYALTLKVFDPVQQVNRQVILLWDGQRWFVSTQTVGINGLRTFDKTGAYFAYGTSAIKSIYQLFNTPSTALQKKIISKFYGVESAEQFKQGLRFYTASEAAITYDVTLHSEQGNIVLPTVTSPSAQYPSPSSPYGVPLTLFGQDAEGITGRFLGWTLTTNQASGNIDYMGLAYRLFAPYY